MRSRVTLSFGTMITAPSLRSSNGIAWRSRSLTMPAESSTLRSGKRVVNGGVVTRIMTKAKKPINAALTATIAINRDAPRPLRKPARPCNRPPLKIRPQSADWAIIAYGMVSIWLTKVKGWGESSTSKKSASQNEADFHQNSMGSGGVLIGDIAGCGWCAVRQGHADRWKTARKGIRRRSACSGCKPLQARAGRRAQRQRLRPSGGLPTVWSRARADPQLLTDYRQAR